MISNIFLSRSQSQCLLQAGLPLTEHSSLNVENTEVVLALHVARLYLQDPDKSHKLVFIQCKYIIIIIFTSYSRILPGLDLSCGLYKYPPSV